jgi:hypothetical protein
MPPRGEGKPFIPPAELGGILAYFDKIWIPAGVYPVAERGRNDKPYSDGFYDFSKR